MSTRQLLPLIGALFALYIIWGSTYFAIAVGVASWPPLMMAGIRFLSAGVLLLGWLLATGHKLPARGPLLNAALIGVLLLAVGNGFVTLAEHQHVPSGIAAVMVATVPLFTLCFSRFFGIATRKLEWLGIAIGLAGIVMLNSGGNLNGNPWGALLILIGSLSWAFGSVYGSRIELPTGMMAGAIEMLAAGIVLLAASWLSGETLTRVPSWSGIRCGLPGYLWLADCHQRLYVFDPQCHPGGGHQLRLCQPGGGGSAWYRIRWRKPVPDRVAGAGGDYFCRRAGDAGEIPFPGSQRSYPL